MEYFEDCDRILKIHYNHYFKGPKDENNNPKWTQLGQFVLICEQNLNCTDYGYIQAIHFQLTSEGYLEPVGKLHDLTWKAHKVTAKGFAFVLNGGYKEQVRREKEKLRLGRISANGAWYAWIVAIVLGSLQIYIAMRDTSKDEEIKNLQKTLLNVRATKGVDLHKNQKSLFLPQILGKSVDSDHTATKKLKKSE